MTAEHETILKMIEDVDPSDTAKLDEIDARVHAYAYGWTFKGWTKKGEVLVSVFKGEILDSEPFLKYTRSRDALKAIRPEGAIFSVEPEQGDLGEYTGKFIAQIAHVITMPAGRVRVYQVTDDPALPTEELAELHAIIQAIAHERAQVTA